MKNKSKHTAEVTTHANHKNEVSDQELLAVIADFLEMGHVENIVAMFRQDPRYYEWTGKLLTDERFAVRLGVSVLFEYLSQTDPAHIELAIPSLVKQLQHSTAWVRGEAVNVLGLIGSKTALAHVQSMQNDPDSQVTEIVNDILGQDV